MANKSNDKLKSKIISEMFDDYKIKLAQIGTLEMEIKKLKEFDIVENGKIIQFHENTIKRNKMDLMVYDKALESLGEENSYIVKQHSMLDMSFRQLEKPFKNEFDPSLEKDITPGALQKRHTKAIELLERIIQPLQEARNIFIENTIVSEDTEYRQIS